MGGVPTTWVEAHELPTHRSSTNSGTQPFFSNGWVPDRVALTSEARKQDSGRSADSSLLNLFFAGVGHNKCHFRTGCSDISPYLWRRVRWTESIRFALRPDRPARSRIQPIAGLSATRKGTVSCRGFANARAVTATRMDSERRMPSSTAIPSPRPLLLENHHFTRSGFFPRNFLPAKGREKLIFSQNSEALVYPQP